MPSEKIELSQIINVDHLSIWILNEIEWFQLEGILEHAVFHAKGNSIIFHAILKYFHMFSIRICRDVGCNTKLIYIKCSNCHRTVTYILASGEEFNIVVNTFVIHSVFQNVLLLCIIDNNKHYKFEMDLEDTRWTDKGPWHNTTICTKLNAESLEDYFKTG